MEMNHLYQQNNNGMYQFNNNFKDFDEEIYTIKDLNREKISDIMKDIQNKKDIEKPHLSQEKKDRNIKMSESMKRINELYYTIFDIKDLKKKYENQKERKYQDFKAFMKKKEKKENLQKIIDDSLYKNLKESEKVKSELNEKAKSKNVEIDNNINK